MTNSLVTGGAGFIGSHLARELLTMNHHVVILDDLSGGFMENIPEGVTFVKGSILDQNLISNLFQDYKFDYVYHLAAYAAEGLSHFIRRFNYQNNLIGSINLINESIKHQIKCFVFTSSIAVYGQGQLPMDEELIPLPEDPYGVAKLAVEQDLRCAHEMFGLNSVIFRPHNVYGEYQNLGDKYRNVVGIFMNQLMQGKPLTIFGDGLQSRAFSYVGDIIPAIAKSATMQSARNQVFNIGADASVTVKDLAEEICRVMRKPSHIQYLKARNEVVHVYASHTKANNVFGNHLSTPLSKGLKKMAAWALKTGSKKSNIFKDIEITKNLPPSWLDN